MVFGEEFKERIEKAIFNINVKTSSLDAEIITELIVSGKAREIVGKKATGAGGESYFFNVFPTSPQATVIH
jgi:Mor family transcriptional regulator